MNGAYHFEPSLPETQPPGAIMRVETGCEEQPIAYYWSTLTASGEPGCMVVRERCSGCWSAKGEHWHWVMASGPDDESPAYADPEHPDAEGIALDWLWEQGPPFHDVRHLVVPEEGA